MRFGSYLPSPTGTSLTSLILECGHGDDATSTDNCMQLVRVLVPNLHACTKARRRFSQFLTLVGRAPLPLSGCLRRLVQGFCTRHWNFTFSLVMDYIHRRSRLVEPMSLSDSSFSVATRIAVRQLNGAQWCAVLGHELVHITYKNAVFLRGYRANFLVAL